MDEQFNAEGILMPKPQPWWADQDRSDLLAELRDRFGPPPPGIAELIETALIKKTAEKLRLQAVSVRNGKIRLQLRQDSRIDPERLIALVSTLPGGAPL